MTKEFQNGRSFCAALASILVVEPNAIARESLGALLVNEGFHVAEAKNGPEAIELLDGIAFDIVVIDPWLHGENPFAVIKHANSMEPRVPVVVMTTNLLRRLEGEAIRSIAQGYLLKPILFEDMLAKVRECLGR